MRRRLEEARTERRAFLSKHLFLAVAATLAACAPSGGERANVSAETNLAVPVPVEANASAPPGNAAAEAPVEPTRPSDRTPVSEAPFAETSAQGAANVVQTYYALLEAGRAADAWRLWGGGGEASNLSQAAFAERLRRYRDYHAEVFAPGAMEGAAGSSYVDVPVRVYGHTADGRAFSRRGTVTLRRVNDVPGSTAEQRRWHLYRSDVEPPA